MTMLDPYLVVDMSDERGLFCGMVLGDLGADVVRIEPPGGNKARLVSPAGSLWAAWARNSRSVIVDADTDQGQAQIRDLVASADFFVESADPGAMAERGLSAAGLLAANPALIYISITPWGQDGPKASVPATDLTIQAASGALAGCGEAGEAPLHVRGHHAWAHAGAEAAVGALVAHHARLRSGCGQHVDISAQDATSLAAAYQALATVLGSPPGKRSGGGIHVGDTSIPTIYQAADGIVSVTFFFGASQGPYSQRLMQWIYDEGECDEETRDKDYIDYLRQLKSGEEPMSELARLVKVISRFLERRKVADLFAEARRRNVMLAPCATLTEVLGDAQLAARQYWRVAEDVSGSPQVPGGFVRCTRAGPQYRRRAPQLGECDVATVADGRIPAPLRSAAATSDTQALAGLKVLDLSWIMAGPYTTRIFADFGATVVKVESETRLDGIRVLPPYIGGQIHPEHSGAFQSVNAGKLSIALNPALPAGREVVHDLVRWADVVAESFSPKVMTKWGLAYDDLIRIRPDVIMISSTIFGQTGPYALMPGVGTMGAALGGLVSMTGRPGRLPTGPFGPYTDFVAPKLAASAVLAALDYRDRTGEGNHLDLSQIEASLPFIAPELFETSMTGQSPEPIGNRDPQMVPHGVYRTAGEDNWVAIACRDDDDWCRLRTAINCHDTDLSTADARRRHEDEIDKVIEAWTTTRSAGEVEATLVSQGIPTAAVVDHRTYVQDPQLNHRGHFIEAPHSLHGTTLVESTHILLSRTPATVRAAGPTIGEHTNEVLRRLLGYDDQRIVELQRAGAIPPEE